jgi:signal transduction histidine kinase
LSEQQQMSRYLEALDRLGEQESLPAAANAPIPLLLPPLAPGTSSALPGALEPLISRAAATAALQGRPWQEPTLLPPWRGDSGAVAEILANLLENAFRYGRQGAAVGLHCGGDDLGGWQLTVWDGGSPIPEAERQLIFERGIRGSQGAALPGSGLGLALARDLARSLGGELELLIPPAAAAPELPAQGNAFRLRLPPAPPDP